MNKRMTSATPELLNVSEVAIRLRVPKSWVYGHADDIGALRVGKYLRFVWPQVLERLAESTASNFSLGSQPNDHSED